MSAFMISPNASQIFSAQYCPISGLAVTARDEWMDLPAGYRYAVSFALIGDRILLCQPAGDMANANGELFQSHRQRVIAGHFGATPPPLVEIRDLGRATGSFPRENRRRERDALLWNEQAGVTLIVCNAPPGVAALYRTIAHCRRPPLAVLTAEDYGHAMRLALECAAGPQENTTESVDLPLLLRQVEALTVEDPLEENRSVPLPTGSPMAPLQDALMLFREDMRAQLLEAQERDRALAGMQERLDQETGQRSMAERRLLEAISMTQAANTAKGEFLSNISHEIRTPMNGIIGLTELLLSGELPPDQRRYMDMIKASASRLLTLLNDILDYSKIETGKLEIVPITFNFRDMAANALKPFQSRAQDKGIALNLTINPNIPAHLIGDPGRFRQVLTNLVANAIKFTDQGSVTVIIDQAIPGKPSAFVRPAGDEGIFVLYCRVEDTGIGIPEDKKDSIFEAFRQADGSATRKYGGVGLGLAIARQIVELMGGSIWVETPPWGGTVLHFTAQLRRQTGSAMETGLAPLQNLKGVSLLIVENNPTDRFVMREMMQRWFRIIETVENAKGLRSIMEQHPFDLVLLGKELPDLNGFEAARTLSRLSPPPRVILLTSKGQRGDAQQCRDAGIEGYLMKPIAHTDLLRAIRTILARPTPDSGADLPLVTRHYLRETSRQVHILLAENDYMSQVLSTAQLEGQGWRVTPAANGREVLGLIDQDEFSFLVLDICLSGTDGFALVAEIREREKESASQSVLIGIGSQDREEVIRDCMAAGFDGYVQRPLSVERLREEAGRLVDGLMVIPRPPEESAASDRTRILDTDRLLASRCQGNRGLARQMVNYLVNEGGPEWLRGLENAIAADDADRVREFCHTLGSTAESLFAAELSDAVTKLFRIAAQGSLAEEGVTALDTIRNAFLRAKTLGEQFLGG